MILAEWLYALVAAEIALGVGAIVAILVYSALILRKHYRKQP
jgi:hypothetical protein